MDGKRVKDRWASQERAIRTWAESGNWWRPASCRTEERVSWQKTQTRQPLSGRRAQHIATSSWREKCTPRLSNDCRVQRVRTEAGNDHTRTRRAQRQRRMCLLEEAARLLLSVADATVVQRLQQVKMEACAIRGQHVEGLDATLPGGSGHPLEEACTAKGSSKGLPDNNPLIYIRSAYPSGRVILRCLLLRAISRVAAVMTGTSLIFQGAWRSCAGEYRALRERRRWMRAHCATLWERLRAGTQWGTGRSVQCCGERHRAVRRQSTRGWSAPRRMQSILLARITVS